jgi:predicted regulator of Ras-like GTPase activity (Roadblock/LC7/MglB family)
MALKGTLADMAIIDLIQFPHVGRKTGHLIVNGANGEARLFYESGSLVHATMGNLSGMEALVRVVDWSEGEFEFLADLPPEIKSIELDLHRAVMQALKIHDELKAEEQRRASTDTGNGEIDEELAGKLSEFIGSNDFALHACVLDSDGKVKASADGDDESPEGIDELRSTLHSFVQSHSRGVLNRILVEDNLGTVVLVRLTDGCGLIVIARQGASLGAVSMSVSRLATALE